MTTTEAIVFPDSEFVVKTFLAGVVEDAAVDVKLPSKLPARFIQVRRVGGVRDSFVTITPRLDIRCWGTSDTDSEDLATFCETQLLFLLPHTVQAGTPIYRVTQFLGPIPAPDTDTGRPTYLQTIEARMRGTHA